MTDYVHIAIAGYNWTTTLSSKQVTLAVSETQAIQVGVAIPFTTGMSDSTVITPSPTASPTASPPATATATPTPTSVPNADLSISITGSSDALMIGENATYQLAVVNAGPLEAQNVVLVYQFDHTSMTFVSASPSVG